MRRFAWSISFIPFTFWECYAQDGYRAPVTTDSSYPGGIGVNSQKQAVRA